MATATQVPEEAAVRATLEKFMAAQEARDIAPLIECFADDAVVESVQGTFRGKNAIASRSEWEFKTLREVTYEPRGVGHQICGSMSVFEGVMRGTNADGYDFEAPVLVLSEFDESGKITRMSSLFNEWTLVKQAATQLSGLGGAFYRLFTGRIDSEMHKGVPTQS